MTETEKEKYSTALLFKQEVCRKPPEKIFWTTVGQWYEAESFIEEAFFAMRRTEDYNLLRDFAIRNYAEICEELNLKLSTVKSHIYSLYRKLGVKNRMQATLKGKEMGILK